MGPNAMFAGLECRFDRGKRRHHDTNLVAKSGQSFGQRPAHVGETAGLGERSHFRAEEKDFERLHEGLSALSWRSIVLWKSWFPRPVGPRQLPLHDRYLPR